MEAIFLAAAMSNNTEQEPKPLTRMIRLTLILFMIVSLILLLTLGMMFNEMVKSASTLVPEIKLGEESDTWETKYWYNYDASSPPGRKNKETTHIEISLSRVTLIFGRCDELHLNFLLVQEWTDERLTVKDESKEPGSPVMNFNLIKRTDQNREMTIWRPNLATDPMGAKVHSGKKDETWIWKDGKVYRTQQINLSLQEIHRRDRNTLDKTYSFDIYVKDFFENDVSLKWTATSDSQTPIIFKMDEDNSSESTETLNTTRPSPEGFIIHGTDNSYRLCYITGHCDMQDSLGDRSGEFVRTRSCLRFRLNLEKI